MMQLISFMDGTRVSLPEIPPSSSSSLLSPPRLFVPIDANGRMCGIQKTKSSLTFTNSPP
jgi:hypothetical protein